MKYYLFVKQDTGLINQVIHQTVHHTPGDIINGCLIVEYDSELTAIELLEGFYYKDGAVAAKPVKPSEHHVWNLLSEQYEITEQVLDDLRNEKKKDINRKFETLNTSMIQVGSYFYDADPTAIKNISGKLTDLSAKQELGIAVDTNTLFWRDALNNTRTWSTVADYTTFLQQLAVAISDRTTALYVKAWQKKSEVDELTDPTGILSYPVASGW